MTDYSLNALYKVIGISKQGVWDHFHREEAELNLIREVIGQVDDRRTEHPGEGLEKLYWQIQPDGMGRDKFCDIFMQLGYGVRRRVNRMRTTIPAHKVFDNLIEGRLVSAPNQVWQSDITYIKVGDRFYYLTFIIDVYTRQIVGYAVSDNLRAEANIKALKMAVNKFSAGELKGCVHHSDRGSQYTDGQYLKILRTHKMPVSMGGRAQDNAFAERINGVIKNEYLIPRSLKTFRQLTYYSKQAVIDYNTKRHHGSLGRCSPVDYEAAWKKTPTDQQKVEVIRSENTPNFLEASLQSNAIDTSCQYPYCTFNLN
ncbi:MAG: IS3 family transposase [Gracilimonas sp.]|nr:IS3 family transposase [Gracilimonas sp.]